MVVTYLEKIKNQFTEEKIAIKERLTELLTTQKENEEFIRILKQNENLEFDAFTPRTVNNFNKKRMGEIKEKQESIIIEINSLKIELEKIEKEIEEVSIVIQAAKEKRV